MDFEEIKYRLRYFYEDYGKYLWVALALIIVGVSILAIERGEDKQLNPGKYEDKVSKEEALDKIYEKEDRVRDVFSLYNITDVGEAEGNITLEIDIFLKKPYMESDTLRDHVRDLFDLYYDRYTDKKNELMGMKLNVYTRDADYREGMSPLHEIYYQQAHRTKETKKRIQEEAKEQTLGVKHESSYWRQTLETPAFGYKYNDMKVDMKKYKPYKASSEYEPLSDEEYEFYLKLVKYGVLMRSDFPKGVIQKYLEWEYGVQHGDFKYRERDALIDSIGNIIAREEGTGVEQFSDTMKRFHEGDLLNRFRINNPLFYLYMRNNQKVTDVREARQKIFLELSEDGQKMYEEKLREIIEKEDKEIEDIDKEVEIEKEVKIHELIEDYVDGDEADEEDEDEEDEDEEENGEEE